MAIDIFRNVLLMVAVSLILRNVASLNIPGGARIFHPAFPHEVLTSLSQADLDTIEASRRIIKPDAVAVVEAATQLKSKGLPWKSFPEVGIDESQLMFSAKDAAALYEENRYLGFLVWAHKIDRPEAGCLLVNHWRQQVVLLESYNAGSTMPSRGVELCPGTLRSIEWPALGLETDLLRGQWQAVRASDTLTSGEVLSVLPPQMTTALWELVVLLLLPPVATATNYESGDLAGLPSNTPPELQALLDTGLSPKRGLVAYIRLLRQLLFRASQVNDLPGYRRVAERDLRPKAQSSKDT